MKKKRENRKIEFIKRISHESALTMMRFLNKVYVSKLKSGRLVRILVDTHKDDADDDNKAKRSQPVA